MSILGKIFTKGKKGLTDFGLEEIRVEEKRLEIRENQHLRQIEKYDKLREEVFHQGAKNKSPARRRIYARPETAFEEYQAPVLVAELLSRRSDRTVSPPQCGCSIIAFPVLGGHAQLPWRLKDARLRLYYRGIGTK